MTIKKDRRELLKKAGILAGLAVVGGGIAACSTNPLQQPVRVDLATAQAWANEIVTASQSFVADASSAAGGVVSPAIMAQIGTALKTLQAVNSGFQTIASGNPTVNSLVNQIIQAAQTILGALVPLFPAVASVAPEVTVALMILTAFVNSVTIVVPPMPAAGTLKAHYMAAKA